MRFVRAPGNAEWLSGYQRAGCEAGKPSWNWEAAAVNELLAAVEEQAKADLGEAYRITDKAARYERVGEVRNACVERWLLKAALLQMK